MTIKVGGPFLNGKGLYDGVKAMIAAHGGWTIDLDTAPAGTPFGSGGFTLEFTSITTLDGDNVKVRLKVVETIGSTTTVETGIISTNTYSDTVSFYGISPSVFFTYEMRHYFKLLDQGFFYSGRATEGFNLVVNTIVNVTSRPLSLQYAGHFVTSPINTGGLTGKNKLIHGGYYSTSTNNVVLNLPSFIKYGSYNTSGVLTNNVSMNSITGWSIAKNTNIEGGDYIILTKPVLTLNSGNGIYGTMEGGIFFTDDIQNGAFQIITSGGVDYLIIGETASPIIKNAIYIKWVNE